MVIEGGSLASQARGSLTTKGAQTLSTLFWSMVDGDEVQIQQRCQINFVVGDDCKDKVWSDKVTMDVEDVFSGRSWIYIKDGFHQMQTTRTHFLKWKGGHNIVKRASV